MKTNILILSVLLNFFIISLVFSQAPEGIKYQAVARNAEGIVLADKEVLFDISIIQGSVEGVDVYSESHTRTTNKFGIVTLTIGKGETSDDFSKIDWKQSPYFVNIKVDGLDIGTSQLLSVPYALYATEAGNVFNGDYNNLTNKPDLSVYITKESDPDFNSSVAHGITSSDTAKWNQAYNSIDSSLSNTMQPVPIKFQGDILFVHPFILKSSEWGPNNMLIGGTSDTDGRLNTEIIVKILVDSAVPAKTCYDLVDFGYDDWYLPSRYEIDAIYKQSYLLKYIDYSSQYWSSTEMDKDMAWQLNFYNGTQSGDYKKRVNTFICIRRDK